MKKILLLAALICLLVNITNPMQAQLIIRNSGHAEIGVNPAANDADTVTTLKLFGDGEDNAAGARLTFGNIPSAGNNVAIGEKGNGDSDQLWLHGKSGTYLTKGAGTAADDTVAYFDPSRSSSFTLNSDVTTHGVFIQSDERLKEDIEPIEDVLNALTVLSPVSYRLTSHLKGAPSVMMAANGGAVSNRERRAMDAYYRSLEQESGRYGFLAQNVKEVFPELVHTDMDGYMSVDYIGLIPILVQSINELRAQLAEVKGEQAASSMMQSPQQSGQIEANLHAAKLYQNAPNPWSSETVIRYSLPQSVAQAMIYIYDMQGKQLKSIPAQGRGESQVTLTARDLTAGMYLYALVADGALVDSKQMILTK